MPKRLFTLYQRKRWININVNAIAAAAISTLMVMALAWLIRNVIGYEWGPKRFTAFALVADIILDVACFLTLHWVANHWRPVQGRNDKERAQLGAERPNSMLDSARVQAERMAIGPLYYLIASLITWGLQESLGTHPSWAIGIGYAAALVVTRTIHTAWGLRSGSYVDHHKRPGNGARKPNGGAPDSDRPADAA